MVDTLTADEYYRQSHPNFSPVGWHLGHIAFAEALWILEHLAGQDCPFPQYRRLFAADGLPKAERENLPDLPVVLEFLQGVRDRTWDYLESAPLAEQHRLWWWLLQHESQHAETMRIVLAMHRWKGWKTQGAVQSEAPGNSERTIPNSVASNGIYFPATSFLMGYDGVDAFDNERAVHPVQVNAFWIDPYPVTQGSYRDFMEAGGYESPQWWSAEGWAWLQQNPVSQPLYWVEDARWDTHPVCGVSWYEADAYARFVGKRLPTEREWELAATWNPAMSEKSHYSRDDNCLDLPPNPSLQPSHTRPVGTYPAGKSGCYDLLGNVWEWTASWFEPYPNFVAFPYRGYSQAYFDGQHRVLRGGSWATFPWALRSTFRNWYHPDVRQIFAGFRCAQSVS